MSVIVPLFPQRADDGGRPAQSDIVAALDIGSTQIACLIGEVRRRRGQARPTLDIISHGLYATRGVKAGVIVDPAAAEHCIRMAVDKAERTSGVQVEEVWVNLSGGNPHTQTLEATIDINGKAVKREHLAALSGKALAGFNAGSRLVVQVVPAGFSLDGGPWIADPEGLVADRITGRVNVVTMARGPLRNLEQTLEAAQLKVGGLMVAPLAAAEAVLAEDERELGVTVVDIGAAQTSWAAFREGMLLEAGMIPLGGHHVTQDIAAGLSTPIAEAERLKTLQGSVLPASMMEEEMLSIPVLGEQGPGGWQQVPRSTLQTIIRPRMEEILELLQRAISHLPAAARQRMVFTGGGAQLTGLAHMVEEMLGARVRIGAVRGISGLPPVLAGPAHAVVAGLLMSAIRPDAQGFAIVRQAERLMEASGGYIGKVRRWFRESF